MKAEKDPTVSDGEARKSVSEWKNVIKHMDKSEDAKVTIDPMLAARFYIELAWVNFTKLRLPESRSIRKFLEREMLKR